MSNLLKDASILLTPTAYENGRMNATKPYKDLYGPELVTNGDFSNGSTDWTISGSASVGVNKLNVNAGAFDFFATQVALTNGLKYKVTLDAEVTSGDILLYTGTQFASINSSGSYTFYTTSDSAQIRFRSSGSGFVGSITNVSVVEDLSGDFTFSRGSAATRVNAQGLVENVQIISPELVSNGDFSQIGTEEVSNGDFSQIGTEEVSNGNFSQEGSELVTNGSFENNINGWLDYLSDSSWDNGTIKTTCTSNPAYIRQNSILTSNKQYKITFKAKASNISQNILIYNGVYVDTGLSFDAIDTYKEFTYYLSNISSSHFIIGQQNLSIGDTINFDNVSVKEVGQDWDTFGTIDANNTVSFANNELTLRNDGTGSGVKQSILTVGKTYKVSVDVTDIVGNGFKVDMGNLYEITTIGTKTFYLEATNVSLLLYRNSTNPQSVNGATITNISVKEVGQDWNLGTGWSIGEDKAIFDGGADSNLFSTSSITSGKAYKYSFTISDMTTGALSFRVGSASTNDLRITEDGTYSGYTVADGGYILARAESGFNGSITNISVKEVGQDWTFGTGWSVDQANSKAVSDTTASNLTPSTTLISGRKYKFSLNSEAVSSGSYSFLLRFNSTNTTVGTVNSDGSHEFVAIADSTSFRLQTLSGGSTDFSITNISVKEITDDTDLPRINYEGFSYQDSLGSEEIINGDFSNGSANWIFNNSGGSFGWQIYNGKAICDSNASTPNRNLNSTFSLVNGKSYKLTLDILQSEDSMQIIIGGTTLSQTLPTGTNLNYEYIITDSMHSGGRFALYGGSSDLQEIDNVSVKEYLGQEVVPDSGCGSWLLEPQSTNITPYSEDFTQSWTPTGLTITPNSIASPSGEINSDKWVEDTSNGAHSIRNNPNLSVTSGNNYTMSIFAKAGERTGLRFANAAESGVEGRFDLSNGTVTLTGTNTTFVGIEDYGNGWYRCIISFTASATIAQLNLRLMDGSSLSYQGNGTSGLYAWGAMLENQSYATSYIPTSGAANTRLQDIATNSGNSTLINSTEGVLYAEIAALADDLNIEGISISDGSTSNRVVIFKWSSSNTIRARVSVNGVNVLNQTISVTNITDFNKIAISYKLNDFKVYINGTNVFNDTSGATPIGLNTLSFSTDGTSSAPFYGKNKALAVYKEAKTDANLRCLTYPNPVATTFDLDFDTIAEQFTFTRGSEATFVNEQGLIESTNTLTSNLVIDEESLPLTGWSRDGDVYTAVNASSNVVLNYTSGFNFSIGDLVEVSYEVFDYVSGQSRVQLSGGGQAIYTTPVSSNGVFTETLVLTGNNTAGAIIHNSTSPTLKIRNLSIKKVITATNTPRIDYSTGEKAFLLEPQSTNLITYSEDFSNSYWRKDKLTVTSNSTTSPSGDVNASLIQEISYTSAVPSFDLNSSISLNGSTYTCSFYVKPNNLRYLGISFGSGGERIRTNFDFNTETFKTPIFNGTTTGSVSFDTLGDYYRISINATFPSTTIADIAIIPLATDTYPFYAFQDSDNRSFYLWGMQLEQKSYATSYIPTSGATATRNQESCADATPVINSEEGTLYAEILKKQDNNDNFILISLNNAASNSDDDTILIGFDNGHDFYFRVTANGSIIFLDNSTISNKNQFYKVALKYKSGDIAVWVNGVEVSTSTNTFSFAKVLDNLSFDYNGNGVLPFYGNTKGLKYYPKALADVQLEDLTTI